MLVLLREHDLSLTTGPVTTQSKTIGEPATDEPVHSPTPAGSLRPRGVPSPSSSPAPAGHLPSSSPASPSSSPGSSPTGCCSCGGALSAPPPSPSDLRRQTTLRHFLSSVSALCHPCRLSVIRLGSPSSVSTLRHPSRLSVIRLDSPSSVSTLRHPSPLSIIRLHSPSSVSTLRHPSHAILVPSSN